MENTATTGSLRECMIRIMLAATPAQRLQCLQRLAALPLVVTSPDTATFCSRLLLRVMDDDGDDAAITENACEALLNMIHSLSGVDLTGIAVTALPALVRAIKRFPGLPGIAMSVAGCFAALAQKSAVAYSSTDKFLGTLVDVMWAFPENVMLQAVCCEGLGVLDRGVPTPGVGAVLAALGMSLTSPKRRSDDHVTLASQALGVFSALSPASSEFSASVAVPMILCALKVYGADQDVAYRGLKALTSFWTSSPSGRHAVLKENGVAPELAASALARHADVPVVVSSGLRVLALIAADARGAQLVASAGGVEAAIRAGAGAKAADAATDMLRACLAAAADEGLGSAKRARIAARVALARHPAHSGVASAATEVLRQVSCNP